MSVYMDLVKNLLLNNIHGWQAFVKTLVNTAQVFSTCRLNLRKVNTDIVICSLNFTYYTLGAVMAVIVW
jgi:hypothetical protein